MAAVRAGLVAPLAGETLLHASGDPAQLHATLAALHTALAGSSANELAAAEQQG
jgi:hypothetical protein